jgi:hypothetical protein
MKKIEITSIVDDDENEDELFINDLQFKSELNRAELGDSRLSDRLTSFIHSKLSNPNGSIPEIFKSSNTEIQAAYRFLDNDKVTPEKILKSHIEATLKRLAQFPVMLLIDDLSYFDYTNKGVADELGMTGNRNSYGLVTSPLLAVTPDRHCMGLADWKTWCRDPKLEPSSKRWFKQKIEEKETFHWLKRYRQTCGWQKELPNTQLIYIADRGSDIIDIYTEAENRKNAGEVFALYVIRCAYDRLIPTEITDEGNLINKIQAKLDSVEPLGDTEIPVSVAPGRSARTALLDVSAINTPISSSKKKGSPVANLTVVRVREKDTTPKNEEPIEWTLLTNINVSTYEEALQIVNHYLCRWQVELYFKVLKSGCGVEELYLQTKQRLENCLAIFTIVAWRLLYLTQVARKAPNLPCTVVFSDSEWKATYRIMNKKKPLPSEPISLKTMILYLCYLGGIMPRKGCEFPGIKSIWKGMQKVYDYANAYDVFVLGK